MIPKFALFLARLEQWHAEFKARTVLNAMYVEMTRPSKIDNYNCICWLLPTITLDSLDTNVELTFRLYRLKKCHFHSVQKFENSFTHSTAARVTNVFGLCTCCDLYEEIFYIYTYVLSPLVEQDTVIIARNYVNPRDCLVKIER